MDERYYDDTELDMRSDNGGNPPWTREGQRDEVTHRKELRRVERRQSRDVGWRAILYPTSSVDLILPMHGVRSVPSSSWLTDRHRGQNTSYLRRG